MKDSVFTLKGDNGTGINWDSWVGAAGFKLDLTVNRLHSVPLCAQGKETVLFKRQKYLLIWHSVPNQNSIQTNLLISKSPDNAS